MPDYITQFLLWLVVIGLVMSIMGQLGGKGKSFVPQLLGLILFCLLLITFFAPESRVGMALFDIISFLLKPLGLSLLLLLNALSGLKRSDKGDYTGAEKHVVLCLTIAFLILLIFSTPFIANWLVEKAEIEAIKAIETQPCCQETADAIVLLGQNTTKLQVSPYIGAQLTEKGDRINYAARLYRQNFAPHIIVTAGQRPDFEGRLIEAENISKILTEDFGIPKSRIIIEPQGLSPRSSAAAVKKLLPKSTEKPQIILVTSALEMRRSSQTFRQLGIIVIPAATDFYTFSPRSKYKRKLRGSDFLPSVEALAISTHVIDEYLASLYYLLRLWLAPAL